MDKTDKFILIVEDDADIAGIVAYNLRREGFGTRVASDGETGLEIAFEGGAELILLDIMLPGMNGYEVCRRVRAVSDVPVIMLTARDSEDDKVNGLETGADDYITKPFGIRELVSRVKANLRRSSGHVLPGRPETGQRPQPEGIGLNEALMEATLNGRTLDLSTKQFELLKFLCASPDTVFTREEILTRVWGYDYYGGTRIVDVAVRRLRERLNECEPGSDKLIGTKHGAGYFYSTSAE